MRLLRWLRRPYDRCHIGGHRMGTKQGYWLCRKHWEEAVLNGDAGGSLNFPWWGPRAGGNDAAQTPEKVSGNDGEGARHDVP